MAHLIFRANINQFHDLRMHGDQVHAEWLRSQRLRCGNFRIKQFGRHRPARNHPKPAGVGNGRHKVPFRNPRHSATHNGDVAAKKFRAALHEVFEFGHSGLLSVASWQ